MPLDHIITPTDCPPVLNRLSHLSDDAQKVLAAIYRQYQQQKENMVMSQIERQQSSSGTNRYYQSVYRAKIGSTQQDSQSTANIIEDGKLQSFSDANDRHTVIPSTNQMPRKKMYYQQLNFNQSTCTSSIVDHAHTQQTAPLITNPIEIANSRSSVIDSLNQYDVNICSVEKILDETGDGSFSVSFESNPLSLSPSSPDVFPVVKSECKVCNKDIIKGKVSKNGENLLKDKMSSCLKASFDQSKAGIDCSEWRQLILDENVGIKTKLIGKMETTSKEKIFLLRDSTIYIPPTIDMGFNSDNGPENVTGVTRDSVSSISKRLIEHHQLRKEMEKNENTAIEDTKNKSSNLNNKRKIAPFFAPYKKSKISEDKTGKKKTIQLQSEQSHVNVLSLNSDERMELLKKVEETKEILLTLMYKDAGNQLRDGATKKKQQNQKPKCIDQVTFIVFGLSNSETTTKKDSLILYSIPTGAGETDIPFLRKLWESIFKDTSRKVCYGAKELFILLFKKIFVDPKVAIHDWNVLDPQIAGWLLDPDNPTSSFEDSLKSVNLSYDKKKGVNCTELLKSDLLLLGMLMGRLFQKLQNRELWNLFCCLETKLVPLIAYMECQEVQIDTDKLLLFSDALKKKLQKLEQEAYDSVGHSFVINSTAQLRQVLFEELKLDTKLPHKRKLTKTSVGHQISTSEVVLQQLIEIHPLPGIVLEYRQFQKMKSTYMDGIMSCVQHNTLSTHWDQISAATGRLSSYQPNVQAIPKAPILLNNYQESFIVDKENDDTLEIYARDIFKSQDSWSYVAADFQQIELRLLAHLADDDILLQIFRKQSNNDIFIELTSQWLGKPVSSITSAEREQTKRIVYSVMYGAGKEKLAEYLKISADNAKAIMNSFLVKLPAVNQFSKKCVEFCQKHGYTSTIFNRKRMIPNIKHPSPPLRAQAERQAVNFCVQGSAADLCKAAMLQIEQALRNQHHLRARQVFQIHDEILLEVHDDDIKAVTSILRTVMEDSSALCGSVVNLRVPVRVSVSVGKKWGHMSPLRTEL